MIIRLIDRKKKEGVILLKNKVLDKMLTNLILEDKGKFYRIAFTYVKNKEDALDIVQESIHKALKTVHTVDQPERVKSWFYRIIVNTSLDLLRKQKREIIVDEDTLEFVSPISNDAYENVDLARILDELPPKYRIIIILKFFEDLTIREISEVLHENENTVKTRLYKALKMLRIQIVNEDQSYMGG